MNIYRMIKNRIVKDDVELLYPIGYKKNRKKITNAMMTISLINKNGIWCFNDEARGLVEEPFVLGIPAIIESTAAELNITKDLKLIFSKNKFPQYNIMLERIKKENGGAWYKVKDKELKGWLCPATLLFFDKMPKEIYVKMEGK